MSAEVSITGNITRDLECKFTDGGQAWVPFSVAVNHRIKKDGEWVDAGTSYFDCVAWGRLAENLCNSVSKGTRVIVTGAIKQRKYTNKDDVEVTTYQVNATKVSPDLSYATAVVSKNERSDGDSTSQTRTQRQRPQDEAAYAFDDEPF